MGRNPARARLWKRPNGKMYVVYWNHEARDKDHPYGRRVYKSCEAEGATTPDLQKKLVNKYADESTMSAARVIAKPSGTEYGRNMREAVTAFLEDVDARKESGQLKLKSALKIHDAVDAFRDWLPETLTTGTLNARHLERFIREKSAEYADATLNGFRQNVKACLKWLAKERPRNFPEPELFWDALKKKRVHAKPATAYTPEQLAAFRAALPPDLERVFLLVALTGARISEVFALTWDDVDLSRGRITFRHQLKQGRVRVLPLLSETPGIVDVAPGLLAAMKEWSGDTVAGPGAERNGIWWATYSKRAGVKIHPQALRRNFTSYAASCGVPASVCAGWQGHSAAVAEDHYRQQVLARKSAPSIQAGMGL